MTSRVAEFKFACVVWGSTFVKGFLDVCLASMLTRGNLPHLAERTRCTFRIYTTAGDIAAIRASASYRRLKNVMPVEIAVISAIGRVGRYQAMTQCHADFIRSARADESALVFVCPDVVWADGAGARLYEILASGKRMVALLTPRVVKETFLAELLARYQEDGQLSPIPSRDLVRLSMLHLHPELTAAIWRGQSRAGSFASGAYWMAEGGYLARQFHLFPLAVVPEHRDAVPAVSVDADYCLAACPDPSDVYIVEDSDDLCLVDFTTLESARPVPMTGTPVEQMVSWARGRTDTRNREFATHVLRYHWTDVPLSWDAVERQSDDFINAVLAQLDRPDQVATSARPSRARYFSPRFIIRNLREHGVRGAAHRAWPRVYRGAQRRLFGSSLQIKVLSDSAMSRPPQIVRPR